MKTPEEIDFIIEDIYKQLNRLFQLTIPCEPGVKVPRPEPKKPLADKLRDGTVWTFKESNHTSTPLWETTAKAALEHFSEIVDEVFPGTMSADLIKKKFKDSL